MRLSGIESNIYWECLFFNTLELLKKTLQFSDLLLNYLKILFVIDSNWLYTNLQAWNWIGYSWVPGLETRSNLTNDLPDFTI